MDLLRRYAEEAFYQFLRERGRNAPQLDSVSVEYMPSTDRHRFCATFSDGTNIGWEVDSCAIHEEYRALSRDSMGELQFFYDCRSLYSRMYENHLMEMELAPARQHLEEVVRLSADPAQVERAYRNYREIEQHVRTQHMQPPAFQQGLLGAGLAQAGYQQGLQGLGQQGLGQQSQYAGAVQAQAQYYQQQQIHYQNYLGRHLGPFDFGLAETGDPKAQNKGLKLLKEWLSPEQLEQYKKHKFFEVIGSDTGKRYRIRHGRQMNIDELDRSGAKVCGWCFLPEGGLVSGDVMLAQKIALETNEREALKTANRF